MKHLGFLLVSIVGSFILTILILGINYDGDVEKVARRFTPMLILFTFVVFCLMEGLFLASKG